MLSYNGRQIALGRIDAGIAILNEKGPYNWWKKINLERLDLANTFECVLGQLYGTYHKGLRELGIQWDEGENSAFYSRIRTTDEYIDSPDLNALWTERIEEMRDEGNTPDSNPVHIVVADEVVVIATTNHDKAVGALKAAISLGHDAFMDTKEIS